MKHVGSGWGAINIPVDTKGCSPALVHLGCCFALGEGKGRFLRERMGMRGPLAMLAAPEMPACKPETVTMSQWPPLMTWGGTIPKAPLISGTALDDGIHHATPPMVQSPKHELFTGCTCHCAGCQLRRNGHGKLETRIIEEQHRSWRLCRR